MPTFKVFMEKMLAYQQMDNKTGKTLTYADMLKGGKQRVFDKAKEKAEAIAIKAAKDAAIKAGKSEVEAEAISQKVKKPDFLEVSIVNGTTKIGNDSLKEGGKFISQKGLLEGFPGNSQKITSLLNSTASDLKTDPTWKDFWDHYTPAEHEDVEQTKALVLVDYKFRLISTMGYDATSELRKKQEALSAQVDDLKKQIKDKKNAIEKIKSEMEELKNPFGGVSPWNNANYDSLDMKLKAASLEMVVLEKSLAKNEAAKKEVDGNINKMFKTTIDIQEANKSTALEIPSPPLPAEGPARVVSAVSGNVNDNNEDVPPPPLSRDAEPEISTVSAASATDSDSEEPTPPGINGRVRAMAHVGQDAVNISDNEEESVPPPPPHDAELQSANVATLNAAPPSKPVETAAPSAAVLMAGAAPAGLNAQAAALASLSADLGHKKANMPANKPDTGGNPPITTMALSKVAANPKISSVAQTPAVTPLVKPAKVREKIQKLYSDSDFANSFLNYTRKVEFNNENVEFLLGIKKLEAMGEADPRFQAAAKALYDQYGKVGAPQEVNLKEKNRNELKSSATANKFTLASFDNSKVEIEALLDSDVIPRFEAAQVKNKTKLK